LLLVVFFCAIAFSARGEGPKQSIDFNRDIRPILSENCYFCHGPDKNKRKADLRLDTKGGLFDEIDDVRPVVPGKPAESDLLRRITTQDEEDHMPPAKSNKSLSAKQVALIKRWIEEGAEYKGHWAYIKPVKVAEPSINGNVKNAIDKFILAKLKEHDLQPGVEADKITLCRRIYFDLLGLPPTPQQVDAFTKDQRPDAYEKLVDELLASPHFGERMAVFWLDQVRYADTIGYHSDNPMNVSPYRDWVIAAFSQNMPFDQFTIEQLAGDLLPNSGVSQKVASAYNRLLQTTEEGGAQPREYEAKYAADRVRNVSAVWMAQTMGCCECHDHKFDPITTKEFYGMEAFFADVMEAPVGKREPGMPLPNVQQQEELKQADEAIADARAKLNVATPELAAAQIEWEKSVATEVKWETLDPQTFTVQGESKLKKLDGGLLQTVYKVGANENYTVTAHTDAKGITGFRLEALPDDALPAHGPGNAPNGNFVLSDIKITATLTGGKPVEIPLRNATADFSQEGFPIATVLDAKRKNRKNSGWAIFPEVGKPHEAFFEVAKPLSGEGGINLTFTLNFQSQFPQHTIGKLRLSCTTAPEPSRKAMPANVRTALAIAAEKRSAEQKETIAAHYRTVAPLLQSKRDEVAALEQKKQQLLDALPKCLVTTAAAPRVIRVLPRGNWLDGSGPVMAPVVPASLGRLAIEPADRRATRLDLARWIASRDNPLTARVFVNRIWKMFYGQGIARKVDDLGSQGEWPTHPELLDWLAVDFMESGWDIKRAVRQMVTSATYRQTSVPTKEQRERDPANQWLAHQARFRLDAEFVRDNALAVSGLLVDHVGGKSVFPYQPAGYWSFLNFPAREWQNDKGEGLYRRGLYTHWQRTFLQPSLLAFDAPTREEAVCERTRSNVPQQALALLNDPTYVEAARVFAERIVRGASVDGDRLEFAFRQALSRSPKPQEAKLLLDLLEKHRKEYLADPAAAVKLISAGDAPSAKDLNVVEWAAWTSVARTILNLHETITRN
jgi:hypothetical protein